MGTRSARQQLRLGATLGVAITPADAREAEMAMRVADEAMVRAKRDDRGSIGRASPADAAQLARTAAIIRAFDVNDLGDDAVPGAAACLQPIVALAPGAGAEIVAVEALARWTHPDVGEIPPDALLPMIGPARAARLGRAVRALALAAFAALRAEGLTGARLALNLSAGEVARPDIALQIAEQVHGAGLSLQAVELEINEDVLLERVSDRTLDQLAALRGRGARLVLDDFGTGNSGLLQLLRLPLDGLKLDKRFVQRLGLETRASEIVRASVSVAHGLGLKVVAEGVETERQAAILRTLGCDSAQGFLFARPMTAGALRTWLRDRALDDNPHVVRIRPRKLRVTR